jgi:serine/threonine protein phosphatase PrpC
MRRRGVIEYRAAMRVWQKLGIPPLPDTATGANKQRALLSRLSADEKKMLARVTREENEFDAIKKITEMHPGKRELEIKKFIIKAYEYEGWKENVGRREKTRKGLYEKLNLDKPDTKEKLEAIDGSQVFSLAGGQTETKCNLEMVASIALKLRDAAGKEGFSVDRFISELKYHEVELLMDIAPSIQGTNEEEAKGILVGLGTELREKINRRERMKPFYESVKKLRKMNGVGITALRKALAYKKEEETLLEFFGTGEREGKTTFMDDRVFSLAKGERNGDSGFSADIEYRNGKTARIDGIFDGVSFSDKPGEASERAREVFEIMIQLRPPENAHDLRLIMTVADLAVFIEYGDENTVNLPSTTGVVTLLSEDKLTGVHAGDSRWMVFRDGKLLKRSIDHSYEERFSAHGIGSLLPGLKNQLASSLGNVFDFLDSSELELKKDDAVVLCSDGVSGGVSENEIADAVSYGISKTPETLISISKSDDDKTVIAYLVEKEGERISMLDSEFDLAEGRSRMSELAATLGVQQNILETAMISLVRGDYDSEMIQLPNEEEMFELEMILESTDAEKMAKIALLLRELRNPAAHDKDNKFKQLHDLIQTLDGEKEKAIKIYDRFHFLLGESGKFDRPAEKIKKMMKPKKRVRKFRKRGRK